MATTAGYGSPSRSPAAVLTNVTSTHFKGYVRKEESWPEDSPEYQAGFDIVNRKKPPPPEVPGDAFDRQRVIPGFDQGLIERQVCLVLGTGGVGQDVALTLARLGVAEIILVDNDTYEASNLTRQCLGSASDVGKPKVDVAAKALQNHHSIRSSVMAVHCDAVHEWPRIVELARRATVLFNCIDVGVMWDFCINSLSKELALPLVCGQSFGWKFMAEFYSGAANMVCGFCFESTMSSFQAAKNSVERAGGVKARLESFAKAQGTMTLRSEALRDFLVADNSFRLSGTQPLQIVSATLERLGCEHLNLEVENATLSFLQTLHDVVIEKIVPGKVSSLPDIGFVPKPAHANTRYVGSWVCPCLGCAVTMVSQWAAWLTAPRASEDQFRDPPVAVTFNLDSGMTSEEQLGYELGSLGVTPDKAERKFSSAPSKPECATCSAAQALKIEESLFHGRLPVVLSPVPGETQSPPQNWCIPKRGTPEHDAAVKVALARTKPLVDLGEGYSNVVVPAMPAVDAIRDDMGLTGTWPSELQCQPLLKVPSECEAAEAPSAFHGVASGIRSALVKIRGRWWRLKGCGNNDEGFPVETKGDHGEDSIRGCCFKHTAENELMMTHRAAAALAAKGLDCANIPAGMYRYEAEASWPFSKIDRYCVVFETLGNARLGDNLLAGLITLLPLIIQDPGDKFDALKQAIAAGRGADADDLWPTATVVECGMATADVAARLSSPLSESPPSCLSKEAASALAPSEFENLWNSACASLGAGLESAKRDSKEPSLLLWLAWRLGWECGATVAALHAANISWGTYPDSLGIHCNAHINNLVVKPPGVGRDDAFLAALDFDMAFHKDAWLPESMPLSKGLLPDTWEGLLKFEETMGMATVLAGSDFTSTGVSNIAVAPETHALVEMAMRDTLVTAYQAALHGDAEEGTSDAHPNHVGMRTMAHQLIRLALACTVDAIV